MKLNQKGVVDMMLVAALAVVLVIGGLVLIRVSGSNDAASTDISDIASTDETGGSDVEEAEDVIIGKETFTGTSINSGLDGFSITIPDGWNVTRNTTGNVLRILNIDDMSYQQGNDVEVTDIDGDGSDSNFRFVVIQFEAGDNYTVLAGDESSEEFTSNGITGTRYYKKYPVEPIEGIGPYPGQETYVYEFANENTNTYVIYDIQNVNQYFDSPSGDDPNQLELVDQVVRTLEIN